MAESKLKPCVWRNSRAATRLTFEFQGETGTLWQFLALQRGVRRYFERVKRFCETGSIARRPDWRRGLVISLGLSVLAVASFSVWLGWIGAFALAAVLVLHEFGHWLAMRMTGQPAPRMLLIPFFGGMAVANHPHRTLFHDAFCSLMGPGFSALLALGLLVVAWRLGMPPALFGEEAVAAFQVEVPLARKAIVIALVIGLLNALQLLPVLPLDGGHILRALAQSFNPRWARWILLVVTVAGGIAVAYWGFYVFAAVLVLGALQAWHMSRAAPRARPMGGAEAATIVVGFLLCIAVHGAAVTYGTRLIGWQFF